MGYTTFLILGLTVLFIFMLGFFLGSGSRQKEIDAIRFHLEHADLTHDKVIGEYKEFIQKVTYKEVYSEELIEQPQQEVSDELLMAYGVRKVSELPHDVRRVWDKDYDGGAVQ